MQRMTPTKDPVGEALIANWHDVEMIRPPHQRAKIPFPVLFYDVVSRGHQAQTEPCIYCGRRHAHGNLEGSRVPHCGLHTHDLTVTGRRRWLYARGVTLCDVEHRDYILRPRPLGARIRRGKR
jgi:hypothetical protein